VGEATDNAQGQIVAVIDIGSNLVRLEIAQVVEGGALETLERMQRPIRLGQDTFVEGRLGQRTMSAAVGILRDYRRVLDTYRADHVRAVATSAVREAANADAFLDRIFMATNLDVEVIEPAEESRLTVGAVLHSLGERMALSRGEALIADIGGGSALLTLLREGEICASGGYRLGSIRLQEMLGTTSEPPLRAAELLRHQIASVMTTVHASMSLRNVRSFIAVGGDARFAGRRVGEASENGRWWTIRRERFDDLVGECTDYTADELSRIYGLPYADAETLVPALLAYQALLHETRAAQIVVSDVTMRDGLLLDLAPAGGYEDTAMESGLFQSARSIGEKYHYDAEHAEHVTDLALQLFDAMQREHRLSSRHRVLLGVAGLLHDVGTYVNTRAHHKHSYYLVSNSEIFGLRKAELGIVAHVARYHRKSCPKPSHIDYMSLPREQRMVVSKLAAILRVADALDRGHAQHMRRLRFELTGDELVVNVPGAADLTLERRAVAAKADLFEEIYGRNVRLEEAELEPSQRRATAIE
jgi:exopolyphosphatase/guanosine-5'-triphosphate,3'-diphosphate pyrophosphatase